MSVLREYHTALGDSCSSTKGLWSDSPATGSWSSSMIRSRVRMGRHAPSVWQSKCGHASPILHAAGEGRGTCWVSGWHCTGVRHSWPGWLRRPLRLRSDRNCQEPRGSSLRGRERRADPGHGAGACSRRTIRRCGRDRRSNAEGLSRPVILHNVRLDRRQRRLEKLSRTRIACARGSRNLSISAWSPPTFLATRLLIHEARSALAWVKRKLRLEPYRKAETERRR